MAAKEKAEKPEAENPVPAAKIIEKVEKVVVAKDVQLGSIKVTLAPDEEILTWTEYPDKVVYYVEGKKTGQKVVVKK
jgi:hypothetical protein